MSSTHEIHRRALSAAIAVIGRHRHRAGVAAMGAVLSGSLACVPDPDDVGSSETASEATTMGATTIDDTALSDATGMTDTNADTDAMTTGSGTAGEGSTGGEGTGESSDGSTGDGTTSTSTTDDSTTDDPTTGDSTTGDPTTSTGGETGLSDCKDGDGETDWECCADQNWEPAEHCTPWGPPAPPRFTRRAPLPRLV